MRFQEYWEELKPRLDDALDKQLSILLENTDISDAGQLRASLDGGKRIRGCLVCMVSDALGGNLESAIPRAVAVELIQIATLIHDDFVYQDTVRRNRPAAWTLEGARRAVLLGDVIFATANKMMNDLSREDGLVISEAIAEVAHGAFREPLNPLRVVDEVESGTLNGVLYEKIIRLKTGALFGAASQMGAIAGGANAGVAKEFRLYGLRIGEAYQIADDLHEVRQYLLRGSIDRDRMVVLTPAFLYFVKDMKSHIPRLLKDDCSDLDGILIEHLHTATRLMENEIDRRLRIAVSEVETGFPGSEYTELIRQAPWDMIEMILGK